jgi:uncharacterized protein
VSGSEIVVSGTITPHSIASTLLSGFVKQSYNWILTDETFNELREVLGREWLRKVYHIEEAPLKSFIRNLAANAEFVKPIPIHDLPLHSRDNKDDILLACALAGNCDYLITGDKDLLSLAERPELGKLKIVTVSQFLQL